MLNRMEIYQPTPNRRNGFPSGDRTLCNKYLVLILTNQPGGFRIILIKIKQKTGNVWYCQIFDIYLQAKGYICVPSTTTKQDIMRNPIVICNICNGQIDIFADASDAADRFGVHPKTILRWIKDGAVLKNGLFVGRGQVRKSNRGGKR